MNTDPVAAMEQAMRILRDARTWQPIATAPKESLAKLVYEPRYQNIYCASWHASDDTWYIFGGNGVVIDPTHWMPLPENPAGDEA